MQSGFPISLLPKRYGKKEEDQMFDKAKNNLHENDGLRPGAATAKFGPESLSTRRRLNDGLTQRNADRRESETEGLTQQTATSEMHHTTELGPPSGRLAVSDTSEISCIGSGMVVLGKIST